MTIRIHSSIETVEDFYSHLGPLSTRSGLSHDIRLNIALIKNDNLFQEIVAIQTTSLRSPGRYTLRFATQQILLMKGVEHENLTRFLSSFYSIDSMKLSIVSSFMDGESLTEVVESSAPLAEDAIASVTLQVCCCFQRPKSGSFLTLLGSPRDRVPPFAKPSPPRHSQ